MITVGAVKTQPQKCTLDSDPDTYVVVKPATLSDESARYEMLFSKRETAYTTDVASVELWLTCVECNILDENGEPVLRAGVSYEEFQAGLTAIWNYAPEVFWELHQAVRSVNPHWEPEEGEAEGNA
jgi:hypothetical protein